jgi:hypothetical protein
VPPPPPAQALQGTRLRKRFPDGCWYAGTVASYDARRRLYRISYDDDDREELDGAELRKVLSDMAKEKRSGGGGAQQAALRLRSVKRARTEAPAKQRVEQRVGA